MQKEAEYGVCAHWSYKEKIDLKKEQNNFEWLKDVPDFWKTFKIDFFPNKVFSFTPKGDVIVLPKGSTPIDFAYQVHTAIGNRCIGAIVDGKNVTLTTPLKNGQIVSIRTANNQHPHRDWLTTVKTEKARSAIRVHFGMNKKKTHIG